MAGEKKDNEEFSFIKEKIKDKPVNKKRFILWMGAVVVGAVVFGLIASVTIAIVTPGLEMAMEEKVEPGKVTIPQDENVEDTMGEVSQENDAEDENQENQAKENEVKDEKTEPETVIVNNTVDLTADDFKTLYRQLANVASVAGRYMVTVTGVINEVDWFQDTLESANQDSGIIFADNGQELLILTSCQNILDAQRITLTFCDGKMYGGYIKAYDPNTNISVVAVPIEAIEGTTQEAISKAILGNSYAVSKGDLVVAIGSPLGYTDSATYGVITSSTKNIPAEDTSYRIITTDAIGSDKASGALINTNGEVVGFIKQDFGIDNGLSTITGIAISDLKGLIEKLSNNAELLKLGIKGSEVTTVIAEEHNIPVGLYVKEITMDSPAMNAGIQSGDILIGVDDTTITSFKELQIALSGHVAGEQVTVKVMRQGKNEYKELELEATLIKR